MSRIPIPQKLRFEVLKRDSFKCQYCGASGKEVVLEVDHVIAVAEGGDNHPLNLSTACFDCNRGKGKNPLSEKASLEIKGEQYESLKALREQQELMLQWYQEISSFDERVVDILASEWLDLTDKFPVNKNGRTYLKRLMKKYEVEEILSAIQLACKHYLVEGEKQTFFLSALNAWSRIEDICKLNREGRDIPEITRIDKIADTLRTRFETIEWVTAVSYIKRLVMRGNTLSEIQDIGRASKHWEAWKLDMEVALSAQTQPNNR